jgi:hypothetical protein
VSLTFEIGDSSSPRGHAIVYFHAGGTDVLATYVLVLPIAMDMGKYLPPLLASQLGGMAAEAMGAGISSFAAPPVPEQVESIAYLEELAKRRGDDLIAAGDLVLGDMAAAVREASEAVQEYSRLYELYAGPVPSVPTEQPRIQAGNPGDGGGGQEKGVENVQHVLYQLMSDRDRLGELSKLVGTMRFATDRGDSALVEETDASLGALEALLADHYWIAKVRRAAKDVSENGGRLAQLYVERCYKLLEDDYPAVSELERQIAELAG